MIEAVKFGNLNSKRNNNTSVSKNRKLNFKGRINFGTNKSSTKEKILIGTFAGAIMGTFVPIVLMKVFKSPVARSICAVAAVLGGISGLSTGVALTKFRKSSI